jgi:large subunit ribosomal protein L4
MTLTIRTLGEKVGKAQEAFAVLNDYEVRTALLAEVVRSEMMNQRAGNAHTKTRGEVRGGGAKPWKQKGTGRARHGSKRSPIWVGGGVAHGPRSDKNWHCKINKSARIAALKSAIKLKLNDSKVFELTGKEFLKTKDTENVVNIISKETETRATQQLVLYTSEEKLNMRGFSNTGVRLMNAGNLKVYRILQAGGIAMTPAARALIETRLAA